MIHKMGLLRRARSNPRCSTAVQHMLPGHQAACKTRSTLGCTTSMGDNDCREVPRPPSFKFDAGPAAHSGGAPQGSPRLHLWQQASPAAVTPVQSRSGDSQDGEHVHGVAGAAPASNGAESARWSLTQSNASPEPGKRDTRRCAACPSGIPQ